MMSIAKFTNFSSGAKQLTPNATRTHVRSCDVLWPWGAVRRWQRCPLYWHWQV